MDDPRATAQQLADLAARGDTSEPALARLVDAFGSDATWYEENPHHDGLNARGYTLTLWERARDAIAKLGEPAVAEVARRIEAGDARLLQRAAELGPRIVALAERTLAHGPAALVPAASSVLAHNIRQYRPADALAMYLCAFDRHVPQLRLVRDLLVVTWPSFATPDGRAAILARWADGSLRSWIEARFDPVPWRVRHLVALLAVVPFDEALPLLRAALADRDLTIAFEPLLVIDVARARAVVEADAAVRKWAEPIAIRVASGGRHWCAGFDRPLDFALVEAVLTDAVYAPLIVRVEDWARRGHDEQAQWRALAAHVRHDMTRFDRAATAAIRCQLNAFGPGVPSPRYALQTIGELDARRMVGAVLAYLPDIKRSKNAVGFVELFRKLGPRAADALPHLVEWSREPPQHAFLRNEIALAIAMISGQQSGS